jgi:hypothetical protein
MREGQHINKYVVEFQRLALQIRGWGDGALHCQFYNGLPAHIKDEISRMGKPATLSNPLPRLLMPITGNVRVRFLGKPNPDHPIL